jgi:hypothetical protein
VRPAGIRAARYMSPTLTPSWSAMTMRTTLGGMIWARVAEPRITPLANRGL